jgi:hypothetical protein
VDKILLCLPRVVCASSLFYPSMRVWHVMHNKKIHGADTSTSFL